MFKAFFSALIVLSALVLNGCVQPAGQNTFGQKYNDTGLKFETVDQLLEICRAVSPGQTTIGELTEKFGLPQNQLAKPQKGRDWVTWRAGDPVIQIVVRFDRHSGIIEAASGKYQFYNDGEFLWVNTSKIEASNRCVLKAKVFQNTSN